MCSRYLTVHFMPCKNNIKQNKTKQKYFISDVKTYHLKTAAKYNFFFNEVNVYI